MFLMLPNFPIWMWYFVYLLAALYPQGFRLAFFSQCLNGSLWRDRSSGTHFGSWVRMTMCQPKHCPSRQCCSFMPIDCCLWYCVRTLQRNNRRTCSFLCACWSAFPATAGHGVYLAAQVPYAPFSADVLTLILDKPVVMTPFSTVCTQPAQEQPRLAPRAWRWIQFVQCVQVPQQLVGIRWQPCKNP